ncbi:MAG: two-component system sensor histidine kinase NtrB [bacterium]|jgi:two-component system NtrC family sensor kinase
MSKENINLPLNASEILDTIDDGVIVIGEDYKIVYANKRFLDDAGIPPSEVIGGYCYKVSHFRDEPCDPLLESCSIEEVIKKGKTVKVIHGHYGRQNKEIAVEINSTPFYDVSTGKKYAVEVLRCLGNGSNAHIKFNLSQRLSEVGLLAEGVAHEINNPLNNILASIDMIKMCVGNSALIQNSEISNIMKEGGCNIKKYFDLMKQEIERCKEITKKMLILSRPVSNSSDIVNVNKSIEESLSLISFTASKKNIMIKKNLASNIPLISFSEAGLRQVLLNIGLNAVHAVLEDSGIIYFITKKIKDYIYIIIIDNGCGIAQGDIKKIFDPFFSKNKNSASTGLGLSISMSIMKSLGGSIEVRSKLDYGTKFTIKIPIKRNFSENKENKHEHEFTVDY